MEADTVAPRRFFDDLAQLRAFHGDDPFQVLVGDPEKGFVVAEVAEEVVSHREDDAEVRQPGVRGVDEGGDEGFAELLFLVGDAGEEFFELVDEEEPGLRSWFLVLGSWFLVFRGDRGRWWGLAF